MSDENPHKGSDEEAVDERPDRASSAENVADTSDIRPGSSAVTRPGWLSSPPPTKPQDEALMRALAKINAIDEESDKSSEPSISPVISPVQRPAPNPSSVRTWAPNPELFSSRRSTAGPFGSPAGSPPSISNPKPDGFSNTPSQQPNPQAPTQPQPSEPQNPANLNYPPPSWAPSPRPATTYDTSTAQQQVDWNNPAQPSTTQPAQSPKNPQHSSQAVQAAMQSLFEPALEAGPPPAPGPEFDPQAPNNPPQPALAAVPWLLPQSAIPLTEHSQDPSVSALAKTEIGQGPSPTQAASTSPRPTAFHQQPEDPAQDSTNPADYSYPIPSYTTIGSSPTVTLPADSDDDIVTGVSKLLRSAEAVSAKEVLGPDFSVNADEISPDEFILDERKEQAFPNLEKQKRSDLGPGLKFPLVGQILYDSYALLAAIGENARCEIYSAMQLKNDTLVAIKTAKGTDSVFFRNFGDAAKTHGKLKHPNIVRSLAYLESGQGQPFYVMENVAGVTLEEILASVEKLDDEVAIAMVISQAAAALEYAHQKEIYHGRLTPHNILMADQNDQLQAKLMDFQLAAVCATTSDAGSDDPYLSPETHQGQPFSAKSDIYSLGVIAYRVATGIVPQKVVDPSRQLNLEPVAKHSPDLRRANQLDELIQQALKPEPSYRFASASEFKEAVQDWIQKVHEEFDLLDDSAGDDGTIDGETGEFESAQPASESESSKSVPAETPAERRKRKRRRKGQVIRTTIHQLVELKRRQHNQERTAVMRFTESVSAKGPRQSPLVSLVKLIVAITLFAGLGLGSAFYIVSNPERTKDSFKEASRRLSELIFRRGNKEQGINNDQEQIKVGVEPMIKASPTSKLKLPPKAHSLDIRATPQFWALPEGQRGLTGNQSPSFGVTNNWQGKKGNRRTIERLDGK